ncbi:hypothetical protein PENSPDRAFT_609395 [Peniophora sp. CONT]|nr:hypothetical protein PENSPDRAFT_609395 [Peniophora sp. CONT]
MTSPLKSDRLNANYLLGDEPAEIKRLSDQHFFVKAVFDNAEVLPSSIDRTKIKRVLDAAAGTTTWALDLSDQPFASTYEVWASDITLSKFPPEDVLKRAGIKTFKHDVTKPFPEEMRGTFDLVHASALVLALTEDGWKSMLKNVWDVLAPGGYLILADSDLLAYTAEDTLPPENTPHDIEERVSGTTPIHSLNSIIAGTAMVSGSVIGLSYRLKDMLNDASYSIISRHRVFVPTGALLESRTSLHGNSLARFRKTFSANPVTMLDTITSVLLSQGQLEAPRGVQITTEEGRLAFLSEVAQAIDEGILVVTSEWVAQK